MDRAETARFLARRRPVAQVADYAFLLSVIALALASAWAIAPPAVDRWLTRASLAVWLVVLFGVALAWFGTQLRLDVSRLRTRFPARRRRPRPIASAARSCGWSGLPARRPVSWSWRRGCGTW